MWRAIWTWGMMVTAGCQQPVAPPTEETETDRCEAPAPETDRPADSPDAGTSSLYCSATQTHSPDVDAPPWAAHQRAVCFRVRAILAGSAYGPSFEAEYCGRSVEECRTMSHYVASYETSSYEVIVECRQMDG